MEPVSQQMEYLDDQRIPAWDTWLAYGQETPPDSALGWAEGYLVAWVPEHLVVDVERMIQSTNSQGKRLPPLGGGTRCAFPVARLREGGLIG